MGYDNKNSNNQSSAQPIVGWDNNMNNNNNMIQQPNNYNIPGYTNYDNNLQNQPVGGSPNYNYNNSSPQQPPYFHQPYNNQPYSNQPYPNQPYPNQPYSNQPYPSQQITIVNTNYSSEYCPVCLRNTRTRISYQVGGFSWIMCMILFIFGCWPCCFLPFCIDDCQDRVFTCENCNVIKREQRKM